MTLIRNKKTGAANFVTRYNLVECHERMKSGDWYLSLPPIKDGWEPEEQKDVEPTEENDPTVVTEADLFWALPPNSPGWLAKLRDKWKAEDQATPDTSDDSQPTDLNPTQAEWEAYYEAKAKYIDNDEWRNGANLAMKHRVNEIIDLEKKLDEQINYLESRIEALEKK